MRNSTVLIIASAATTTVAAPVFNDYAIMSDPASASSPISARVTTVAVPKPPFRTDSLSLTVPDEWDKPAVAVAAATNVAAAAVDGAIAPAVVTSEDDGEYEKEVKHLEEEEWYGPNCTIL